MLDCIVRTAIDSAVHATAGFIAAYVVLLMGVALAVTPAVLWAYRRRVTKLMNTRAPSAAAKAPAPLLDLAAITPGVPPAGLPGANVLERAADDGTRRLGRVLVGAAVMFSIGAGALLTFSPLRPDDQAAVAPLAAQPGWRAVMALADLALLGALCAPMVLIGLAHPRYNRLYWRGVVPVFLLAMATRVALADTSGNAIGPFGGTLLFAAPFALLFHLAFGRRNARNVVPLVAVAWGVVMAGILAAYLLAEGVQKCVMNGNSNFLLDLGGTLVLLASLASPLLMLWPALRLLDRLRRAYETKRFSEAQLQQGCWWAMLLALTALAISGTERISAPWLAALVLLAGAVFAGYLLATRRLVPFAPPCRMLLLRVFSQDERGERLLDEAAFRWRFVGPILMIGGPDLAKLTLDPHELLMFTRGRVQDQFVVDDADLQRRLAALDDRADPDGRYRVDELFCFDTVWRYAVLALLDRSAVVLLDLRGFGEHRGGTAWELGLLARRGAIARTVCLVDGQTDHAAVARALATAGQTWPLPAAQVIDGREAVDGLALFRALAARTDPGGAPAPATAPPNGMARG